MILLLMVLVLRLMRKTSYRSAAMALSALNALTTLMRSMTLSPLIVVAAAVVPTPLIHSIPAARNVLTNVAAMGAA